MAAILCISGVAAQVPEPRKPIKSPAFNYQGRSTAPVSLSEAKGTFVRVDKMLRRALKLDSTDSSVRIGEGVAAVHRPQIVAEMTRILVLVGPSMKFTPRPVVFDARVLRLSDAKQLANLKRLIKLGAVARVGPLATGPEETMTPHDFGDAVGFFVARIAQMTHMPSNKWTPWLRQEGQ